jgi:hypothetical protein
MLPRLRDAWSVIRFFSATVLAGCSLNTHGEASDLPMLDGSPDDLSVVDVTSEPKPDVSSEAGLDVVIDTVVDPTTDPLTDPGEDAPYCFPGSKPCGSTCVKTDDPATGCGSDECSSCPIANATAVCKAEVCTIGACNVGYADCNGDNTDGCEVYLGSLQSCGACYKSCAVANGSAACVNSACTIGSCLNGFADCNGLAADGCEASLKSAQNCGTCATACLSVGSTAMSCATGECKVSSCALGWEDCNQQPSDGCEVDLHSVQNCGACGAICALPHALTACSSGTCTFASCESGWADCDGSTANGCETDLAHDPLHCGACAAVCNTTQVTQAVCSAGACSSICAVGWGDCNSPAPPVSSDGCETHITSEAANCGACGRACSTANASSTSCQSGTCVPVCVAGYENCNKPASPSADDGCESSTAIPSIYNCGGCGISCGTNNVASGLCQAGQCVLTCDSGWGDCNNTAPAAGGNDGCEMDVSKNVNNCGACGRACSTANTLWRSCSDGKCNSPCNLGYANLILPAAPTADDGCEKKLW